jgi:cytochrome subunit of sulfide dehydrogenase
MTDLIKYFLSKILLVSILLAFSYFNGVIFSNTAFAADMANMVEPCSSCHGIGGVSSEAEVPSIAGYSEDYFSYSLDMYLKQERPCIEAEYHSGSMKGKKTNMCEIVKNISEEDIDLMAIYYARQKFVRAKQTYDTDLAKQGEEIHKEKCDECHSESGSSPSDNAGILGGQKMDYLREQIKFVKEGKRFTSKKMKLRLENLDGRDIEAITHYYGSIQ